MPSAFPCAPPLASIQLLSCAIPLTGSVSEGEVFHAPAVCWYPEPCTYGRSPPLIPDFGKTPPRCSAARPPVGGYNHDSGEWQLQPGESLTHPIPGPQP